MALSFGWDLVLSCESRFPFETSGFRGSVISKLMRYRWGGATAVRGISSSLFEQQFLVNVMRLKFEKS